MNSNKDSNLFGYWKDKYGEESVRLRLWDFTVKKMVDHGNHRRFTLRCIKVGITQVSCQIRNSPKSSTSNKIIHKAEKQLLYEKYEILTLYYTCMNTIDPEYIPS